MTPMYSSEIGLDFVPPAIGDPDKSLLETVSPTGWENLGGGLRWYKFEGGPFLQSTEGVQVAWQRISYVGPVGAVVRGLVEHARAKRRPQPPQKSYLLNGAAGIGKTMMLQLIAETYLATEFGPVGFVAPDGRPVYFTDDTGEALTINPIIHNRPSEVARAMASERLDTNPNIQVYNAGKSKTDIKAIDEMIENIKRAALPGRRRVFLIGEIDGIRHDQSKPLKTGLDPNKGIPSGVLVLADTNHKDVVQRNLGAGLQRFKVIDVNSWNFRDLCHLAKYYCDGLGIEMEPGTSGDIAEPYKRMAGQARGSVRILLRYLDDAYRLRKTVTAQDLTEILTEGAAPETEESHTVKYFVQLPDFSYGTVSSFCRWCAQNGESFTSFCNSMARYIHGFPASMHETLQPFAGMASLLSIADRDTHMTTWTAAIVYLCHIGEGLRRTTQQQQYQQQQGDYAGGN